MVVGTDGQPLGPHPHVHILPCPYYTRAWRADSTYSRGERGKDAGWWTLVVARPLSTPIPLFEMYWALRSHASQAPRPSRHQCAGRSAATIIATTLKAKDT